MAFIGKIFRPILKAVGLVSSPGKPPAALPSLQRDDAVAAAEANDERLRRKGGAADILTGSGGAEAPTTGKTSLGQ